MSTPEPAPTAAPEPLLTPELLRKLEQLRICVRRAFAGRIRGERRSPRKGASVEFADFRNYVRGDDLRYLDWNAYARLERLFLKLFVEEEDLSVYVLIDRSHSMAFGEPPKLLYAARAAAALGYIALCGLDRVILASFSGRLDRVMTPARGRGAAGRLFDWLEQLGAEGPTQSAASLREFALRSKRPGLAVVISDGFDPGFPASLRALLHRRFEMTFLHLLADSELQPDFVGDLKLVDSETGEEREITVTQGLLRNYQRGLDEFCGGIERFCLRYGMSYVRCSTSYPFDDLILRYLRRRRMVK
jgi:uncharacterized protein (DUF58 family)